MLKKAVASHEAIAQQKSLAKQLFSSSPITSQSSTQTRPLSTSNANVFKAHTTHPSLNGPTTHAGVKRNSSGLAKALSGQDAFEPASYPGVGSLQNRAKSKPDMFGEDIIFDENDFESDVDLDVEDPVDNAEPQAPLLNVSPTSPRQSPHIMMASPHEDSGYQSIINADFSQSEDQIASSAFLPWSSSPLEHFKKPSPAQQMFDAAAMPLDPNVPKPKASKRRNLPWLSETQSPKPINPDVSVNAGDLRVEEDKQSTPAKTPLPKNTTLERYPWNTTASAVKEQQKLFRQNAVNKKLSKTYEATEDVKSTSGKKRRVEKIPKVFLSEEQLHVLDLVVEKSNSVFFTGSAGTGKSVLLREIIHALKKKHLRESDRVAVTASTGLAACNIGGVTLHSFAGIGLGREEVPALVKKIRKNQKARQRWMRTKILIIDEISMVDGELFDKLEEIARTIKNNGRPFGGIQIVITGDFFQLPPVPDDPRRAARFCFDAHSWNTVIEHTIGLKHVFRQKDPGESYRC